MQSPRGRSRPVVLFGGKNGSGKTTLFEGVKLCLYGRFFQGRTLSDNQYREYLVKRIHKRAGLVESENASVSLEFEHVHLGRVSRYFVERSWTLSDSSKEQLTVLVDGSPPQGIPREQLQDFLIELIPLGLSRLFFFDGEQIQNLANDDVNNSHLSEAFDSLLGLDILSQLETDIDIYMNKKYATENVARLVSTLNDLAKAGEELSRQLQEHRQKSAGLQSQIDSVSSDIEKLEGEMARQGGGFASRRDELKAKREHLSQGVIRDEEQIRELAASLFPFSLVPDYLVRLKNRLMSEEQKQRELASNETLYSAMTEMEKQSGSDDFWHDLPLDWNQRKILIGRFRRILESIANVEDPSDLEIIQGMSYEDRRKILGWIENALAWLPDEVRKVSLHLESTTLELRDTEESLKSIPPDEVLAPIMREINSDYEKLGGLKKEKKIVEETLRSAEFKAELNARARDKALQEQKEVETARQKYLLTRKVQDVLSEFSKRVKEKKIRQVSEHFVDVFNSLGSKKDLVVKVEIDPKTFAMKLLRKSGLAIPKEQLSAGEKQIYAVAMLAALAKTSGRPLPFIIDTPLARLDAEHRTNIVTKFFPAVSHQTIIFSTDTEIDVHQYENLEAYVCRAYLLTYDNVTDSSSALEGYFWKAAPQLEG